MEANYFVDEAQLVCRMCIGNLLEFKECYSIDEDVENLIFNLTSISVRKK